MAIPTEFKAEQEKIRLDKFLKESMPGLSRAVLQRLIFDGLVQINGKTSKTKSKFISKGDKVAVKYDEPHLVARTDVDLKAIYEDTDVLVLDKPAGIVVHPNPRDDRPSIAAGLVARMREIADVGDEKFRPGIVHRLDAETSGLLIVAKNNSAFTYLKNLFKNRKIEKYYTALVHGHVEKNHGFFDAPIGRRPSTGRFETGSGRDALTEYWIKNYYSSGRPDLNGVDIYTLVRIQLHTGRTHQIRVHFSSVHQPVCGDKLYGGKFKKSDALIFSRQFLHADHMKLKLPNGKVKEFVSPLPEDLTQVLKNLKQI